MLTWVTKVLSPSVFLVFLVLLVLVSMSPLHAQELEVLHGEWEGTIEVDGQPGDPCDDPSGTLVEGSAVRLLSESGDELASSTLGPGRVNNEGFCSYGYTIWGIPEAEVYLIEVDFGRGVTMDPVPLRRDRLEQLNWNLVSEADTTEALAALDARQGQITVTPTVVSEPTAIVAGNPTSVPQQTTAGPIAGSDMYRIVGTFELLGKSGEEFFTLAILGCSGIGGYSDISAGAQITIRNESGDILAVSRLEPDPLAGTEECRFQFAAEVPEAAFYSLTMGRRGEITYSFEDMEENGWTVELTLGP